MARRAPPEIATVTTHPQSLGFPPRSRNLILYFLL